MDRIVRIILTGDSAGAVTAIRATGDAAVVAETKMHRLHDAGQKMSSIGRTMTELAVPFVAAGGYAIKTAADFQKSMEMIHTQAGQSQIEVNRMSKALINLAPSLATGPQALSESLYHLESSGLHGAQALSAMKVAAEGAKIGGADLTDVTNALTGAIMSGVKGVGNFRQTMGALNATVGAGDMYMQDMADSLSTGLLGPMKTYGLTLHSVGAALAVFGDLQIRGQEAATKLSSAIRIMAAPSGAAIKALGGIGLGSTKLADDMRSKGGLITAFKDLKHHLEDAGLTASQQALVITRAFGGRQSTGVQILLGHIPKLEETYAQVGRGMGNFGADLSATKRTTAYQWARLQATLQASLVKLGNTLMPLAEKYLPKLVNGVVSIVNWFTHLSASTKRLLVFGVAFLAIGGPILIFTGRLVSAVSEIGGALMKLKGPLGWLEGGLKKAAMQLAPNLFKSAGAAAGDAEAAGAAGAAGAGATGAEAAAAGVGGAEAVGAGIAGAGVVGSFGLLALPIGYAALISGLPGRASIAQLRNSRGTGGNDTAGLRERYQQRVFRTSGAGERSVASNSVQSSDSVPAERSTAGQNGNIHITLQLGRRVLAENTVHYGARAVSLSGSRG